ncbi:MAG: hypothetical protein RLZZ210_1786 [Pseudomonadota bacterium]|jgi:KDO2-lipid IV(A) lauroyltransferase
MIKSYLLNAKKIKAYHFLFLFLLVLSYIPLSLMRKLGGISGLIFYYTIPKFKQKFVQNYIQARPDIINNKNEIKKAYKKMGSLMAELPYVWLNNNATQKVNGDILLLQKLLSQGKGLIIVALHGGAFELIPKYIMHKLLSLPSSNNHGLEVGFTSMYKKPHINIFDDLLLKIRQVQHINIVPADEGGIRKIIRCLKAGQITAVLPDQVPQGTTGVWASFFNKPAYTGILLHKLHKLYDTPLALCHMLQTKNGWDFIVKHINIGENEEESAKIINSHLEDFIKLDYEQYLWGYNRYKTPKGALERLD